jgi:hypothetical protein
MLIGFTMFRAIDSFLEDTVEDAIARGERAGYSSTMAAVERVGPVSLPVYLFDRLYTEFMMMRSWLGCRSRR